MLDFGPLGLSEAPFSLSPDPRFFFLSGQHKTALAKITYTTEQRQGLSVVYGDVGVGKTTVARRIYQIYNDNAQYEAAYLPMPIFPSEFQLLKAISSEFGLPPKRSKYAQIELLNTYLIDVWKQDRNAILIIDYTMQKMRTCDDSVETCVHEASVVKFRAILMTNLAIIAGIAPQVFGGSGAEFMIPMATATMGGVAVSTLFTLFTTRSAYCVKSDS